MNKNHAKSFPEDDWSGKRNSQKIDSVRMSEYTFTLKKPANKSQKKSEFFADTQSRPVEKRVYVYVIQEDVFKFRKN